MADLQMSQIVPFLKKIASWMAMDATCVDFAPLPDTDDNENALQQPLILPKMQECAMKICTEPIHGFFARKLDWHLPKLGGMCCIPEETAKNNALALLRSS